MQQVYWCGARCDGAGCLPRGVTGAALAWRGFAAADSDTRKPRPTAPPHAAYAQALTTQTTSVSERPSNSHSSPSPLTARARKEPSALRTMPASSTLHCRGRSARSASQASWRCSGSRQVEPSRGRRVACAGATSLSRSPHPSIECPRTWRNLLARTLLGDYCIGCVCTPLAHSHAPLWALSASQHSGSRLYSQLWPRTSLSRR